MHQDLCLRAHDIKYLLKEMLYKIGYMRYNYAQSPLHSNSSRGKTEKEAI